MEKAGLKEQFDFIYKKYKEKKDECKLAQKNYLKEQRQRSNQRKIYEKLFSEGMKIDDVKKVM